MTTTAIATVLLFVIVGLFLISFLCEREAYRQMETTEYRYVPQIRFGRLMRIPAMLCVVAFVVLGLTASPLAGTAVILLASILTMATQSQALVYGQATQVFLRGLVPSVLILTTLVNIGLPGLPGLGVSPASLGLAIIGSIFSWTAAVFRTEQDLVAIRD
jgi:hypothetical protein